ncbi:MAG TPA: AAA family ATPase [Gemmatimonadales bacterium]|nr:AAA family ATPase [Gemmatimonadales bacterium]
MAGQLQLFSLGAPLLLSERGEPIHFHARKPFALLIRLAVEGEKTFSRDYLMDLLWPNVPQRLARHSLAQAVMVVKENVGPAYMSVRRDTVAVAEGAVVTDVTRIDAGDVQIRGPFLDDFDVPKAAPFEHWKDAWRAMLAPRMRDCLLRQMDGGRRIGDFATVERLARVLLALDPLSEDAVRGVMEARVWAGDRGDALRVYSRFEARLMGEAGVRPSNDLARIATLLRRGARPAPRTATPADRLPQNQERRLEAETLIGREREFAQLYDAWLAARRGAPRIVVLVGDPGVGKTTLTNAFVSTCQMAGAVVARAQAYDAERELPFAVLAELIRQLAMQQALGAADPDALSELARVSPETFTAFPAVPKPVEWRAEVIPLRLAAAFLKAIEAATEDRPLVLVVDDIHAADNASAAILHVAARKLPPRQLLVILTARANEIHAAAGPGALVSDTTIQALQTLDLEPLAPAASERLVASIAWRAAGRLADVPVGRILQASNGNPLALELLTKEWLAHGWSSLLSDLESLNTQPVATLGIPRAIGAVFERQVRRLAPPTRAALDLAAVLGRRLANLPLYRVVGLSPAAAGEALSRLKEEGFLREVQGGLEFRNELTRAQAYYAIAGPARQQLHRSVGEVLAALARPEGQTSRIEIAWHFLRGDDSDRVFPAALEGAEDALRVGAPYEAEQVLHAITRRPLEEPARHRAHLLLAKALLDQSKADSALPILEELCHNASLTVRDAAEVTRLRAVALYIINREASFDHRQAAAIALEAARKTGDLELVARALFEFARSGAEAGDGARVRAAAKQIARLIEDPLGERLAIAWYARGYCDYVFYDLPAACLRLERAIQLFKDPQDLLALALAHNALGVCQYYSCNFADSSHSLSVALRLAKRIGDDFRLSTIASNLCTLHILTGNLQEAARMGQLSVEVGKAIPSQPNLMSSYTNLAEVYMLSGEREKALQCLEDARKWMDVTRSWRAKMDFLCESANFALMMENTDLALQHIDSVESIAQGRELAVPEAGMFEKLRILRTAHVSGNDSALRMARRARDRFKQRNVVYYLEALAATAWLEKRKFGCYNTETAEELSLFDRTGACGLKAALVAQGFLR